MIDERIIEREVHQPGKGEFGAASMPRVSFVGQSHLVQAHPATNTANKPIALGHAVQQIDDPPIHNAEVACIKRNFDICDALQQAGVLAKPEAAAAKVASAPTDSPQGDFFIEE